MYSLVNLVADARKFLCESETEREDDVECSAQRQFVRKLDGCYAGKYRICHQSCVSAN